MNLNKKTVKSIILILFSAILFFFLLWNFSAIWATIGWLIGILVPVIIGLCAAFIMNPLVSTIERSMLKWKKPPIRFWRMFCRTAGIVASFLLVFGIVILFAIIVMPEVSSTIKNFAVNIPRYANEAKDWLEGLPIALSLPEEFWGQSWSIDWNETISFLSNFLMNGAGNMLSGVLSATATLLGGIWDVLFGLIISIYVLAQKEQVGRFFRRFIDAFFPKKYTTHIYSVARLSSNAFTSFVTGQLLEALIIGILCYIGMSIFRFPYALTVATTIAFTALIPFFGAWLGAIIGCLLILTVSPFKALWFLVFLAVLQQLESNLIYPRVVGRTVGLPGLLVMLAVWIGGGLSGVAGMLLSVPICSVIYTLLKRAMDARLDGKNEQIQTKPGNDPPDIQPS